MARVLAISSFVARGHVGLGAIVPALARLGHEAISLPTVLLSNHPGHRHCAGRRVPVAELDEMLDALDANGWLADVAAVLTGYLPSVAHVRFAAAAASRVSARNPQAEICCDPVLGDDPGGLYVEAGAAAAMRDELVPLADWIFPNRFELSFLSRQDVGDVRMAVAAALEVGVRNVLATSIPADGGGLANVLVMDGDAAACATPRFDDVPHGTGDLMSALFLGMRLSGGRASDHLGATVAGLAQLIAASRGRGELDLSAPGIAWSGQAPSAVEPV
jgi:pyridoxine kinase